MTLAEQLKAEGIHEGNLEVAKRLLSEGIGIAFVAKITGIPLEKLKVLKDEELV